MGQSSFHAKKTCFSPFWGGRGGLIKLTPLLAQVRNHPRRLHTKFQNAKLKTLGVMSQNKNCDTFGGQTKKEQEQVCSENTCRHR